jgi:membrane protein DedA with SNARE-associated domain
MIGLTGLAASVALMVGAGILFGWTFDTSEISLIVLICMAMMIPGWNLWARRKERSHDAGT